MFKQTLLAAAVAAAFLAPGARAGEKQELAEIRAQIRQMQQSYEARLQALEQKLEQAQAAASAAEGRLAARASAPQAAPAVEPVSAPVSAPAAAPVVASAPAAANLFNPSISMVLGGTLQNLSQDPSRYQLQGRLPSGGETGPGKRGFNLGESELTMAANIDPLFSGQLTFALSGEDTVGVEEAFIQTRELAAGLNLKAGRFMSALGYLNSQHAHTWDFVDAPLAYQAFLGGQYKPDGVQLKWLAPLDQFLELGAELGSGASFPGTDRNKNGVGATTVFAHLGDDIGASASYRVGLSWLRTAAAGRAYDDGGVRNAFSGSSRSWIADAIYKWAPDGNATRTNFKLQGEYFRRKESGTLAYDVDGVGAADGAYASTESGWYLQGVYQFMPNWRSGLRYDRLAAGSRAIGLVDSGALGMASFPLLQAYAPARTSLMFDYSPSEFSRLRLQLARDKSRPGVSDNQIFLQYIMSLGTHAAHAF